MFLHILRKHGELNQNRNQIQVEAHVHHPRAQDPALVEVEVEATVSRVEGELIHSQVATAVLVALIQEVQANQVNQANQIRINTLGVFRNVKARASNKNLKRAQHKKIMD